MATVCMACGAENRLGRKFCAQCGAPLGLTCASCGTSNEPEERFCGECGAPLVVGALPFSFSAPSPPPTAEPQGERKQLTVLFADVQGSMDLQENLDPEAWAGIMGRFVAILAEGVRRFGGTVDKFTGDGIMALFGAPVAQEDHARRACHAAWYLTAGIAAYADELRREQGVDLHVRLGLNSGEVVVGRVGDDVTLDPTALGHTVGLAQRMESMAEPGKAFLTEHTARLVEAWFGVRDLGPTMVKGAREPLRVFVLESPATPASTTWSTRGLGASPLVGRDRELTFLEDALAAAAEGQAQVVGVVGEAGVGKSRLCEEFARSAVARGITVRRTVGVSHGREIPLLPILALLRDYFSITEVDTPDQARRKVSGRLLELDPGPSDALPLLSDFLEVSDPDLPASQLAPEVRMRRIFEALRQVTQRRSEQEVLVLLVEDLHWFDPQSETFLERLVESFPGSRTLVVANFRPEFSATWMRHSYYRQLPLTPLRDEAVGQLLGGLVGVDLSLAPLLGFVLERTGGNPFFVEEVVRSLVEDGALAGSAGTYRLTRPLHQVRVPPSVQAVLAARIDRLPAEHKDILQIAAVVGRTFPEAVLRTVAGLDAEGLEHALRALCAAELVQEVPSSAMAEYRFWHALTQEVAYGTMLAERRGRLHGAVARAVMKLEPDRLPERAALIADHFEHAGEQFEAARWSDRAASWALRSDLNAAVRRWRGTVRHLEGLPDSEESLRLGVHARTRILQFGARTGIGPDEADGVYAEGKAVAERLGDLGTLSSLTQMYGSTFWMQGRISSAVAMWLEAARFAEESADQERLAVAGLGPGVALEYVGPLGAGLASCERQLAVCGGDLDFGAVYLGYSPLVRGLLNRARLLLLMGRLDESRHDAKTALGHARERSEVEVAAWTLSVFPLLARASGENEDSLACAIESVRLADGSGNVGIHTVALLGLGVAKLQAGSPDEACDVLSRALAAARETRTGLSETTGLLAHLARAHLACGRAEDAWSAAEEAVAVARAEGARVSECLARLARLEVGRATGRAAVADFDAAFKLVKDTGALTYEPFIHEELGRWHGDERELHEALRLYSAIGATGHARRLGSELNTSTSSRPTPNAHLGL